MKVVAGFVALLLVGCSSGDQEVYKSSANVDVASIPAMLDAIDGVVDSDLAVGDLIALTNSVPLDEEKQERIVVLHKGGETDFLYHVWREQADWVHVYISGPSEELITTIDRSIQSFSRSDDE